MEKIADGSKLIKVLSGNNSIVDSVVDEISIRQEDQELCVELAFKMRPNSDYKRIIIKLINVFEYGFYFNSNHFFYYVEEYKFFETKEGQFYLSLDPADESQKMSDEDQDFIRSALIVGYVRD